jgi:hypothetical protein
MKLARGQARLWLLSLWLLGATVSAQSEPRQVLLLAREPNLARALRIALSSWGVAIRTLEPLAPPNEREAAAQLAREGHAGAVVWLDPSKEPAQLVIYVDGHAQLYQQALHDRAPFDDEAAAALALSVKTVLRNSALAPEAERITDDLESVPLAEAPAAIAPVPAATPAAHDIDRAPSPLSTPAKQLASALPLLRVEAALGVRSAPSTHSSARPLYGLALALFEPWWSRRWLGLAVEAMITQPSAFQTAQAQGSLHEWWLAFGLRGLVPLARFLDLALAASYELQGTRVDGHDPLDRDFAASRLNSALGFAIALDVRLPRRLFLAPRFGVHRIFEPQRYFIGADEVLELRSVALEGTLRLGVGLL